MAFSVVLLGLTSLRETRLARLDVILASPLTLDNYSRVLGDPATWKSFGVTAIYVTGATVFPLILGMATALLLNRRMPFQRLLRTLALIPWAVPGVTATIAFMWLLAPSFGLVNFILRSLGLIDTDVNWFGDPSTAMWAVLLPTTWKAYPFFTLMLLAGLQSIDRNDYEAAALDGAGPVQQFRWITLPSLRQFITVAVIFNAMYAFREFDFIYASTRGGPNGATETIAVRIFNLAFEQFDFAAAATLGVVTFILIAIIVLVLVRGRSSQPERRS